MNMKYLQFVRSYKLWKVFFHSSHVDSIGHNWSFIEAPSKGTQPQFLENICSEARFEV